MSKHWALYWHNINDLNPDVSVGRKYQRWLNVLYLGCRYFSNNEVKTLRSISKECLKWFCIYRAFLVLMTTQISLQYSFTFTHSYSASISTSMRGNSGFSILPKDTSACRLGKLGIEMPTFRLEDGRSTPQPQPLYISTTPWGNFFKFG